MRYSRKILLGFAVCVGLVLTVQAGDFILALSAPLPVKAARTKALAVGWKDQDLTLGGYHVKHGAFGSSAVVEFRAVMPGAKKTIRVELERPIFKRDWQAHAYHGEEPEQ